MQFARDGDILVMDEIGKRGYSNDFAGLGVNFVQANRDANSQNSIWQFWGRFMRIVRWNEKTLHGLKRLAFRVHGCKKCSRPRSSRTTRASGPVRCLHRARLPSGARTRRQVPQRAEAVHF